VLLAYREINQELWRSYHRGQVSSAFLAQERFRRLLAALGHDRRRTRVLAETYLRALALRGDRLPHSLRILRRLRGRYRLAVVTNGLERVQHARVRAAGLAPLLDAVVTSEGCGFPKPDPRIVRAALHSLGVAARDAVLVGDDPTTDGGAARRAGVRFCWMDRTGGAANGTRCWRRVTSLAEVEALLSRGL
jgi:pyrimidine 5'-nucleotidase